MEFGPGMSGFPELLEQRMSDVRIPRSVGETSCRIPVTSVPEYEARVRGLFDEHSDMSDRERPMPEPLAVPRHWTTGRDTHLCLG